MRAARDTEADAPLPDPVGGPAPQADTALGTDGAPSPLEEAEGMTRLISTDRLDVGTPVADLGTEQVSPE